MTASLQHDRDHEAQLEIDVRTPDERLASTVQRLERITAWFEESLCPTEEQPSW